MKKVVLVIVLSVFSAQAQMKTDFFQGIFDVLDDFSGGTLSMCYYIPDEPSYKKGKRYDVCGSVNNAKQVAIDLCKGLPDAKGKWKKKQVIEVIDMIGDDSEIMNYCEDKQSKVNSAISTIDTYSVDRGKATTYPSGKTKEEVQKMVGVKELIKNKTSLSSKAYLSGNQKTLKMLVDRVKVDTEVEDVSKLKPKDFKAPDTLADYEAEVKTISALTINDVISTNVIKVTERVEAKIAGASSNANAKQIAEKTAQELKDLIDENTNKRVGVLLQLHAKDTDLAMPTEESVNLLREDLRVDAIAQIREQMNREAYITSLVIQADESRKNIIDLTAQKTAILHEKFDRATAENNIDIKLIR